MKKILLKEKVTVFLLLSYFHGFDKLLYLILGKITSKTEVNFFKWFIQHFYSETKYGGINSTANVDTF